MAAECLPCVCRVRVFALARSPTQTHAVNYEYRQPQLIDD